MKAARTESLACDNLLATASSAATHGYCSTPLQCSSIASRDSSGLGALMQNSNSFAAPRKLGGSRDAGRKTGPFRGARVVCATLF